MRITTATRIFILFAVTIGCLGCQRHYGGFKAASVGNLSETGKRVIAVPIAPDPRGQTLSVNVVVKSGPNIDCYVVPSEFVLGKDGQIDPKDKATWESKAVAFKKDSKSISFNATMSRDVEYQVVVIQSKGSREESNFDVRVSNR